MPEKPIRIDRERDLVEIKHLIEGYMRKTYLTGIEEELFRCRTRCEERPTKEIELISTLLPYIPENKRGICEEMIRMLKYEQIAREVLPTFERSTRGEERRKEDELKSLLFKVLIYRLMSQSDS